jgi:GrpB-like predicted nucleotidyltransferase (UPF0157 family)
MRPPDPIVVVAYDPAWPGEFRAIGAGIRAALGPLALRIDHVGSTSVPGLDAKPVIDVQVSVEALEPRERFRVPLEALGYLHVPDNPELTKRFFKQRPGERQTHIHVRVQGTFDEQLNLLFRDFLRTHREAAREYAQVKWRLAEQFRNDREGYVRAKEPTVWGLLQRAHTWSQDTGWAPGPSDA